MKLQDPTAPFAGIITRRRRERAGGFGLHAGHDVLVGLDGEGFPGVSESFGHDFDGDAGFDEERPVGVAEAVEADDRDASSADDLFEDLGDGMGMDRFTGRAGEHLVGGLHTDCSAFGGLECMPALEHVDGGGVEVDGSSGVGGLASGLAQFVADRHETPVDRESLMLDVEVVPSQAEEFASLHPGRG